MFNMNHTLDYKCVYAFDLNLKYILAIKPETLSHHSDSMSVIFW